ncbi:hypothetical protein [Cellulomonas sp. SG140]|uniref:hypothetical protein n=1 Tax=Cellulomonas sp. SG140 TaxID=2976536 RepID=UPI0021E8E2F2|nr:hypothetical protein [Cellulomonas sp. SG140]
MAFHLGLTFAVAVLLASGGGSGNGETYLGEASDSSIEMAAWRATQALLAARGQAPDKVLVRYMRAPMCDAAADASPTPGAAVGEVIGGDPALPGCAANNATRRPLVCDAGQPTLPLWRQTRPAATVPWTGLPWTMVRGYGCPEDVVPPMTAEDFRRLPLPAPTLNVQPARSWVLVNKETIVYTDPAVVHLTTDLLGYPMEVEATPSRFTYDFGDGSAPLITTSPGAPWPHHDTSHVYRRLGTRTITLTTTWTGRYRVVGTTVWHDVAGTATTTATSAPFDVQELRAHLVAGTCTEHPDDPGCG